MGTTTGDPHGRSPSKLSAPGQPAHALPLHPPPSPTATPPPHRACNDLRGFFSSRTWEGRWVRSYPHSSESTRMLYSLTVHRTCPT